MTTYCQYKQQPCSRLEDAQATMKILVDALGRTTFAGDITEVQNIVTVAFTEIGILKKPEALKK